MARKFSESEYYTKETIISIGGKGLTVETEQQRLERVYGQLMQTREGTKGDASFLTAKMAGVEQIGSGTAAVLFYEGYKILIPDEEFMDFPEFNKEKYPYPSIQKFHAVFMNSCIGAEVDFCLMPKEKVSKKRADGVKDKEIKDTIFPTERLAVCSRKAAMRKIYRTYWCKRNGSRIINEGCALEARVLRVTRSAAFFESNGVEFAIPLQELSWKRLDDARSYLCAGDKKIVRITGIKYAEDEETTPPYVTASLKQMQEDMRETYYNQVKMNEIFGGRISTPYGKSFFVTLDTGAEVLCIPSKSINRYPTKGDRCTIAITGKVDDQWRLFGKILNVQDREQLF